MPLVPDPKNCDISVKRAIQGLSKKLGYTGTPTLAQLTLSKTCEVAAGLNVLRVTGLQTDDTALTGTLRGAYIDVSNGSTAATGTIRGMELKARTEAPGDSGSNVAVLEGLSISADSKDHSVTTVMRAAEFILDGSTGGTIAEAVGLRIANNLQANKATLSYGLQIYRDSFDYTYDIVLSLGGHITGDSYVNQDLRTTATPTFDDLTISTPVNIYALSHDSFADFVANEHIDHTTVTLTAGSGIAGGGTIAANRTFDLDINSLTVATIAAGDFVPFWDITATATNKKITFANFETTLNHDSLTGFVSGEHFLQTAITNVSTALATGLLKVTTTTGALSVITDSSANWNTAYTHSQLVAGNPHVVTPTELSLVIGTDVQAYDAGLLSLAGLVYASDSFIKVTATDTYAIRTIAETKTDLSLNLVENTALSTWAGTTNITTLGTIATVGNITIADGGIIGNGVQLNFDDTNNYLEITGCKVGIETATPVYDVDIRQPSGTGSSILSLGDVLPRRLLLESPSEDNSYIGKVHIADSNSSLSLGVRDYSNVIVIAGASGNVSVGTVTARTKLTVEGALTLKEQAVADADTAAYGQIWCKTATPNTLWFTDDAGNDGQLMLMRSASINANSDAADVQGCNVLWVDTSGGDVVLGGLANGVDNQLLYVFKYNEANILTIEHQEGTGTQKFMLNTADLTYNGVGICLPFICKNGTWYIAAYPRSFSA